MNTYFAGLIFGTVYEFDHRQADRDAVLTR